MPYTESEPLPIIDVKFPFYAQIEEHLTSDVYSALTEAAPAPKQQHRKKSARKEMRRKK
jgi:hypothetical protein